MTLRVLVVYPFLPHYRYGVFSQLDADKEYDFTFAAGTDSFNGIEVISPSLVKRFVPLTNIRLGPLLWQHGLLKIIRTSDFDRYIFLGDPTYLSSWPAAFFARLKGGSVYFWTIGWHRPDKGLRKYIRLTFYRIANYLMLYGSAGEAIGRKMGYPADRMFRISNSHQSSSLTDSSDRSQQVLEVKSRLVLESLSGLCVGAVVRLNEAKRLTMLIDAVASLTQNGPALTVVIAGDGPVMTELQQRATEKNVNLLLLGPLYSSAALELLYSRLTITVVPAAVGLTAIQSMSFGVPVISDDDIDTQMPEWESIKPGQTGEIYRAGDVEDLSRCINKLIHQSKAEAERVAQRCRQEVSQNWSVENHYRKIITCLRRDKISTSSSQASADSGDAQDQPIPGLRRRQ